MALGFPVLRLGAPERDGPGFALNRTELPTLRARLLGAEGGGFLFQEFLDRALGHGAGGGLGDLFDVVGVEIEIGADPLLHASRDDFPPPLGRPSNPR